MEYRKFGQIDFSPSPLGFGAMRLPCLNSGSVNEAESARMIRYAIDNGVNYVDTAYPYHKGQSEVAVGRALKDGYRRKVALADKSPTWLINKPADFDRILEEQLRRLGDDHIDFYLLHGLDIDSFNNTVLKHDLTGKAEKAKKAGKIGHIGFSFHDCYDSFEKILAGYKGWEFCQIQLNYLDTEMQAGLKGLHAAAAQDLGVVVMEPLMGGKLANPPRLILDTFRRSEHERPAVQWALDYLWDMPEVSCVLSGMSTMEQTVQNVGYARQFKSGSFSAADREIIAKVKEQFSQKIAVPCTGCGYCLPCPSGVSIPANFAAYNELSLYDNPAIARATYDRFIAWEGREAAASSCTGCKVCEDRCPQQIKISSMMPLVAEAFKEKY